MGTWKTKSYSASHDCGPIEDKARKSAFSKQSILPNSNKAMRVGVLDPGDDVFGACYLWPLRIAPLRHSETRSETR